MTVININNISGIASVNAQSNSLELFDNTGASLLDLNANTATFPGSISVGGTVTYDDVTNVDSIGVVTARSGVVGDLTGNVTGNVTGESTLAGISSSIADTAVDIFVYDTSKDSDGGAWRKRTQHTSWYNETLNTSTRGSRREFPAVAVIVVETGQVTIYDGDDPDLPMWMVFNGTAGGASHNLLVDTGTFCLSALNGTVFMGALAIYVNFISEYSRGHRNSGGSSYWNGPYKGNIAERNAGKGSTQLGDKLILGGSNDVAMTVLPNAPVDVATGLPVPTIAVATGGGVSLIKGDGNVWNDNSSSGVTAGVASVEFVNDTLFYGRGGAGGNLYVKNSIGSVSANFSASHYYRYQAGGYGEVSGVYLKTNDDITVTKNKNDVALFGDTSLVLLEDKTTSSLVAYATTSYNTGWMHGDIKGAFLSDTDATNVTGTELVTNGTFTTNTDNWTANGSTLPTLSVDTNRLKLTHNGANGGAYQNITTVIGETYTVSAVLTNGNASYVRLRVYGDGSTGDGFQGTNYTGDSISSTSATTDEITFVAETTTTRIYIEIVGTSAEYAFADNVVARIADPDRSVNNKGLQVFGTVTKSAVATGADLVAYSGFSASNYLQQPVNSDFEFGTGDWAFYGWYNDPVGSTGQRTIFEIGRDTSAGDHIGMRHDASNLELFISDDSFGSQDVAEYAETPSGEWRFACGLRRGSQIEIYSNGVLKVTTNIVNATNDLGDNQSYLRFGNRTYTNQPWDGSLALWRVSKSAPSPEQIKKIYEDEKHLFQENAKCTLYGSSDAVTALAYDEVTEKLHAGTSSGRSDFQGLRRINNTTTAVTTAISAHDEFIVEQ